VGRNPSSEDVPSQYTRALDKERKENSQTEGINAFEDLIRGLTEEEAAVVIFG
jgi:hypothetical protein